MTCSATPVRASILATSASPISVLLAALLDPIPFLSKKKLTILRSPSCKVLSEFVFLFKTLLSSRLFHGLLPVSCLFVCIFRLIIPSNAPFYSCFSHPYKWLTALLSSTLPNVYIYILFFPYCSSRLFFTLLSTLLLS